MYCEVRYRETSLSLREISSDLKCFSVFCFRYTSLEVDLFFPEFLTTHLWYLIQTLKPDILQLWSWVALCCIISKAVVRYCCGSEFNGIKFGVVIYAPTLTLN